MPRPLILAVVSGLLYGFSFPPYELSFLAWIAFLPILLDHQSGDSSPPWFRGFLTGFVANILIFSWIWTTLNAAQVGIMVTLFCWIALAFVLSIYFSVFFTLVEKIQSDYLKPWMAATIWVALENVRSFILTGFPWALFGHTQAALTPLIQIVSVTGTAFISFVLIAFNFSIVEVWKKKKLTTNSLIVSGIIAVCFIWGLNSISNGNQLDKEIKISILQGNIDQYKKWDDQHVRAIQNTYSYLVEDASKINPDLIIWPESAVPGWYPNEPEHEKWVNDQVRASGIDHILGSVTRVGDKDFNSAFFINREGFISDRYDKNKLVPFGEYIPFGNFLRNFIPYLGELGTFDGGQKQNLFSWGTLFLAPNICYEAVFPLMIRRQIKNGGDIIINLTNDGWFLNSAATKQHYVTNIFRAIENHRPVVRAANTGISAIINSRGQEIVRSPLLTEGVFSGVVKIESNPAQTIYTRFGEWFVVLCWIMWVIWFSIGILERHDSRTTRRTS